MLGTRLTTKHLQMVHAIDSARTLTRAADLLSISQPALSSRLHDAEEILGTQLFLRRGRRLTLSPAGKILLDSARRILSELSRVEKELLTLPDQASQILRIGMPQYASYSWLPAAVREFEKRFPSVELEIVSEAAVHPRHALSRDEVDIALVSGPTQTIQLDRSRYQSRLLIRDEFIALLPEDHPKAASPFLVADDFIDETYITNSTVPERNREYELFFQPNSVFPERVVQVGFTGPILELVAAGIGTTIITKWILQSGDRFDGVVSRPLTKTGLFVNWFAIYPRKREIEAQANALCAVIAQNGPE
ncbi:MAG: LysR family transcriptional regulator [Pseudomonadota bacterium]